MNKTGRKRIIGIVGGIYSGKSTVAQELAKLGCAVIDADEIAHAMLGREGVKKALLEVFGRGILDENGEIDRQKLADIVFSDAEKLAKLNDIIHPLVLKRTEELIDIYCKRNEVAAIVLDMPLLVEKGWDKRCDKVIFVDCSEKVRVERAEKGQIFSGKELKIREKSQISLDKKAKIADYIVSNSSDLSALVKQVSDIFSDIISGG